MMSWDDYLAKAERGASLDSLVQADCFQVQKHNIERCITKNKPESIVCLGAGCMHDMPLDQMAASKADLHFADWIPGVCEKAFSASQCKGTANFYDMDVTQGRATYFAKFLPTVFEKKMKPDKLLRDVIRLCKNVKSVDQLPIEDRLISFVTASMLVSQFYYEPYSYFSYLFEQQYGFPVCHDYALIKLDVELRDRLFLMQMEGLCLEVKRLLSENGAAYFSFEMMRRATPHDPWMQVRSAQLALPLLDKYFFTDDDMMLSINSSDYISLPDEGDMLVQAFVLRS